MTVTACLFATYRRVPSSEVVTHPDACTAAVREAHDATSGDAGAIPPARLDRRHSFLAGCAAGRAAVSRSFRLMDIFLGDEVASSRLFSAIVHQADPKAK